MRVQNLCKQIEDWFTWQVKLVFYKLSWKNLIWICVQSKVNWRVLSMKSLWKSKTPQIYCFCCSKLWVEAVVVTWLVKWHQNMTISNFLYSLCATVLLHCHFCAVSSIVIYELTLWNTVLSIFFGITNFLHGEIWCTAWFKRRLPLYLHLPFKCMANYWQKRAVEVQDTSRRYGFRVQWIINCGYGKWGCDYRIKHLWVFNEEMR